VLFIHRVHDIVIFTIAKDGLQSSDLSSCSYSAQFDACVCVTFSLAIALVIPQAVHFPIGFANSIPVVVPSAIARYGGDYR